MTTLWDAASAMLASPAATAPMRALPEGPGQAVPASFAQERLLQLSTFEPAPAVFNVPVAWRAGGAIRPDRLMAALRAMMQSHQAMRLRFDVSGPTPMLRGTEADGSEPLPFVTSGSRAPLDGLLRSEFDLVKGPLWRGGLLEEDSGQLLVLVFHQSIIDGASLRLMPRELAQAYASPAAARRFGAMDFGFWQRSVWADGEWSNEAAHWRAAFASAPAPAQPLHLPLPRQHHLTATGPAARKPFVLQGETACGLQRLARAAQVSNFVVLLTALGILLHRLTGEAHPTVFVTAAARYRPELRQVIGLLANLLPMRLDLDGNPTIRALLRRVHELAVTAFAHQALPFEQMLQIVPGIPPVEVQFLFHNSPIAGIPLQEAGLAALEPGIHNGLQKPPLILDVHEDGGRFHGCWSVREDLLDAEFAGTFTDAWLELLGELGSGSGA